MSDRVGIELKFNELFEKLRVDELIEMMINWKEFFDVDWFLVSLLFFCGLYSLVIL